MYFLLAIVGLVATATAKDLSVGRDGGTLKFEQNFTASPTIWRQEKKVTFNVSEYEVITQVVIEDRREDKNGEATILEGGEGHQNVTIELKSPAVFRGFDFLVQVYAKQEHDAQNPIGQQHNDQQAVQDQLLQDTQVNDKQVPKKGDDVITTSSTPVPNSQDKVQHPIVIGQENIQETGQKTVNSDKTQQSAKDVAQGQQTKDMQDALDKIFTENKFGVKSTVEPAKFTQELDDSQQFTVGVIGIQVPSSTTKSVEGQQTQKPVDIQQTVDTQQATKQVKVPLPYVRQ